MYNTEWMRRVQWDKLDLLHARGQPRGRHRARMHVEHAIGVRSHVRFGKGCLKVFLFQCNHSNIFIQDSYENKYLTQARPKKVNIPQINP